MFRMFGKNKRVTHGLQKKKKKKIQQTAHGQGSSHVQEPVAYCGVDQVACEWNILIHKVVFKCDPDKTKQKRKKRNSRLICLCLM